MASTSDTAKYFVCKSISRIYEMDNFLTETSRANWKRETVSFDGIFTLEGDSFKMTFLLLPDVHYVYISLRSNECSTEFWVKLDVSLIDAKGGKQLTQSFGKSSSLVEKEGILSRFTSRESILDSYLHAGTLKVLFEVSLLKPVASAPVTALAKDYASLLAKGSFSDVTLLVGEKEFPVHKAILSARSSVFARMFTQSKENRFVLEEMEEQVFSELLNYIYTDKVNSLPENVAMELLIAAEKYQMETLRGICGQYISATLTTDNLLALLQLAYQHNAAQLQSKCLAFFEHHTAEVKLTEAWKQLISVKSDLNQELLGLLLQTVLDTDYPVKKKVKLSHVPFGII